MNKIKQIYNLNKFGFNKEKWDVNQIIMNGTGQQLNFPINNISQITSFEGEKIFTGNGDMGELMYYSTIGALLWKKSDDNTNNTDAIYVLTNGNNPKNNPEGASGYHWDPTGTGTVGVDDIPKPASLNGYTLIAVNVGLGKWAYVSWTGLTTSLYWATDDQDPLYTKNHAVCVHGGGYESTQHILQEAENNNNIMLSGTIWEALIAAKGRTGFDLFIPSKYELLDIQNNCCDDIHTEGNTVSCSYKKNLGKLLQFTIDYYWSASQDTCNYNSAFYVEFYDGYVNEDYKTYRNFSVALIHF